MKLRPMLQKHRLRLVDGMKVRVFGYLDFYAPAGQLGLKMADLDPRFTLGDLAAQRDEVIRRLVAEGLLDANKRSLLSPIPLHVGVVSSVNTAAWHDFHDELVRSQFGFHLRVCDVRVQGPTAARGISRAIAVLAARRDLDAIVVIRGGGARNELATFDAEAIARAIASSRVPVFTGLGHEVDRSVADEAAHTAFKTPTACAAALVDAVRAYLESSERSWSAISALSRRQLVSATEQVTARAHRIARRTNDAVERADERLETRIEAVRTRAPRALALAQARVDDMATRLVRRPHQLLAAEDRHLASLQARLGLLDPVNLLARGWSITRTDDGRIVRSVGGAPPGAIIHTVVADGSVTSRVEGPSRVEDPSR
jgi:exodeoxyribonuclease VII large subunit